MEIHIRHAVEFEKVKDWKDAISLTRKRMSIQQLLDSRDSDTMLVNQLTQYIAAFEQALALVVRERHLPLQSIPLFAWNINGETFNSACWKTDAVLARLALAECLLTVGTTQLPNYKLASTTFATSIKQHQEIIQHLAHGTGNIWNRTISFYNQNGTQRASVIWNVFDTWPWLLLGLKNNCQTQLSIPLHNEQ